MSHLSLFKITKTLQIIQSNTAQLKLLYYHYFNLPSNCHNDSILCSFEAFRFYATSVADRAIYVLDEIGMPIETIQRIDGSNIWGIAVDYFTLESDPINHSVVFSFDKTPEYQSARVFRKYVKSQQYSTGNQLFSAIGTCTGLIKTSF